MKVGVIYGGPSNEHDVSVSSGQAILKNLNKDKYDITQIFINRAGMWKIGEAEPVTTKQALELLKNKVEVVFLGLHGTFGEDGHLQSLLDNAGIRYTGSGATASRVAFDKAEAQKVYEQHGLLVPKWQVINKEDANIVIKPPLVIKPLAEGSSVGVSIVQQQAELPGALKKAFQHGKHVMVQEYIDGVEVSCGVVENPEPNALTPTELRPIRDDFFSYEAKYEVGGSDEITPPELPKDTIEQIKGLAITAHEVLDCRGYSRTDLFVKNEKIYMIETNTLPGFTPTSILPQQAEHDRISYTELLDIIITQARHD